MGDQVLIQYQKQIWAYILELWVIHNQHLHQNADQLNLPNYHQAATALYEQ